MTDVFAPAKVNLFLHVTGRHDHYHTLQTACFFPSIGDRLSVAKRLLFARNDELVVSGAFAHQLPKEVKDNLILRVLAKLRENHAIPFYSIHLHKILPVASGIGGGSADVAAVLRVVAKHTDIDFKKEPYRSEIAALGADIPACYLSQPLLAEGIGDEILLWPAMPEFGVVLANPLIPLSTRDVFEHSNQQSTSAMMSAPKSKSGWQLTLKATRNDLQSAAISLVPQIAQVIAALEATTGIMGARMSGSGATCFALYPTLAEAQVAEATLKQQHPNWWIQAGKAQHGSAS